MATTFAAIRDQQATLIEALTPAKHADKKFRRHREQLEFGAWLELNAKAALRRFEIARNFDDAQLPTSDGSLEGARHTMELRVAYPLNLGLYGAENMRDLDDCIDQDRRAIDAAIGLNGGTNYVAYLHDCHSTAHAVLDVAGARVLSMTFELLYDRSV